MIRVRFVTSADPVSWLIRAAEMGFLFSHVECVMPDGTMLGAHADGGVQARPSGYDAAYNPIETIVEVLSPSDKEAAFHDFLLAQIGKPYDMGAIAALAGREAWATEEAILADLQKPWETPDRWICSELIDDALEVAGVLPRSPIKPSTRTPRDVYQRLSGVCTIPAPSLATRKQALSMTARPV